MKYLLAIDIGTSGVKLLLFPVEAGQQPVSLTCGYDTHCPAPGWAEQRSLLEEEGVCFRENGCVDMARFRWEAE